MTSGRGAGRRRAGHTVLAIVLLLLTATPLTALAAPAAIPAAVHTEVPTVPATPTQAENVAAWFEEAGLEAAADHAVDLGAAEDELELGTPHEVASWGEAYLAGESSVQPAESHGQWLAPIYRSAGTGREALGVLRVEAFSAGGPQSVGVLADPELGEAVLPAELAFTPVHDDVIDGWFAVSESEIWPLEAGGRAMLQGPVPVGVFQSYLVERGSTPAPPVAAEEEPEDGGAVVALSVVVVILLLGLIVARLLVRNYRKTDSRIEADVRAGLTPPDGVPLR